MTLKPHTFAGVQKEDSKMACSSYKTEHTLSEKPAMYPHYMVFAWAIASVQEKYQAKARGRQPRFDLDNFLDGSWSLQKLRVNACLVDEVQDSFYDAMVEGHYIAGEHASSFLGKVETALSKLGEIVPSRPIVESYVEEGDIEALKYLKIVGMKRAVVYGKEMIRFNAVTMDGRRISYIARDQQSLQSTLYRFQLVSVKEAKVKHIALSAGRKFTSLSKVRLEK
jgi:hypothetical protein